jgi:hypothetical protein
MTETAFDQMMSRIYSASTGIIRNRDHELVQEVILGRLRDKWSDAAGAECEVICAAMRFVEGPSWKLLYLRIRCQHGWPGGQIEPQALVSIDDALRQNFEGEMFTRPRQ